MRPSLPPYETETATFHETPLALRIRAPSPQIWPRFDLYSANAHMNEPGAQAATHGGQRVYLDAGDWSSNYLTDAC
jgi:hypothetical protein